ncbi:13591_t:CDS:1, partial [Funneliformis geosporum]
PEDLNNNLKQIEDLILKFKFIPIPHKFKSQERFNNDQDDNDGYENEIQIKKIMKTIINQPILVNLWEKIGYEEIFSDYNEFVFHEGFYLIFPRHIPENWISPTL